METTLTDRYLTDAFEALLNGYLTCKEQVARLERGIRNRIDCEVKMEQELNDLKQQLAEARAALEKRNNDTV